MLRITLHYGTNQRGPTIKVPLAVALIGQSCILTQGLGGSNLVSKNTGGQFVWKPPIKANFLSDQGEGEVNQTIKLAHSFLLQPISEEYEYYEKELVLKSLAWVPLKWLHSNQERAMWFSFNVSPGQENQHKSSQSFTLNMQSKLSPFSNFASWKSPLQLHFVALVFRYQESACCFLCWLWLPATTICVNPWRICQVASSSLCKSWFCPH